ncbi:MAG: ATPase P [Desulfobacterales bacterium]|jgi:soluble P-type ATPase|nr:ATPase P [Desulfobacteraceae bacterium]MBT7086453.1 ATPase P [Desulfobacterales bacterium]MBT7696868.1 ATPase P [Desulfobacterales bacterium]
MLEIDIPGHGRLCLKYIVSDYNGTLACDGKLFPEIDPLLRKLSADLEIHVITADTFGIAEKQLSDLPVKLVVLPQENQDHGKLDYIKKLGASSVASLGNGRNDKLMLKESALGICLLQAEGSNVLSLMESDIVCKSAKDALELFLNPKRLIATLRK